MSQSRPVYMDHSATTPMRPEVLEAMMPYLSERFGNPSSIHAFGRAARQAVDTAREQVAALINADPREVFFTSGGTESDNLAIRGTIAAARRTRPLIAASAVEHHAVLHAVDHAAHYDGAEVRELEVDATGQVDLDAVEAVVREGALLVSVMHANNETGVVQPIERVAALCAEHGVLFHCDAVQSAGRIPVDVKAAPVHLLALSAHKLYGPKGVGACYVRKGTPLVPLAVGGAQERGRRAGTENVAAIVGFGKACELARAELAESAQRLARLRDRLEEGIRAALPDARVNGEGAPRLPHLLNVAFPGFEAESLILALDLEGIAVSSGSACSAGSLDPSHVLLAMGRSHEEALSALRFSLGRDNTDADVDRVLEVLPAAVRRMGPAHVAE